MLNFFRFLGVTGLAVIGVLALASMFIQNFWCRYLCPYGGLLGIVALAEPAAHPAQFGDLHRLRQVREGLPRLAARGPHGKRPLGGVHGMS